MNQDKLYQILRTPHISEKATRLADKASQFVFKVANTATKHDIKEAIQLAFGVDVENVQTANVKGKIKRAGATPGKRKSWKKAYVRIKAGQDIDFLGTQSS